MSKARKKWLTAAVCLVVLGSVIFVAAMAAYNWDFSKLSTVRYETNTHSVNEEFSNIAINTDTADILFAPSDDGMCTVVCYESENEKHCVTVRDNTLSINAVCEKEWYEYIGISIGSPRITVYLPETEYASLIISESTGDIEIPNDFVFDSIDIATSTGDVKNYASASGNIRVNTSTGDIHVEDISAAALELSVSTGKVIADSVTCQGDIEINVSTGDAQVTDVRCSGFITNGDTGDLIMQDVIAAEHFLIERSTGDVKFVNCDAAEIFVRTDTGDVRGSLLSEKVFMARTNTGSVDVPGTATGGKCEITTSTGDIRIDIS